MTLKKWTTVLLSLAAFIHCQVGNSQTEFLRNEHLVVAGNDSDGVAKLWITSKLFASTITVPIGPNLSISSAYSEQSPKGRELTVESSYISSTISRHHIFVPLENAVLVATAAYNDSETLMVNTDNNQTSPVQVHLSSMSTLCPSMSRCASLGVYKIGPALYALCASSSEVCICELRMSDDSDGQISYYTSATNCRLIDQPHNDVIHVNVHEISNIVIYQPHHFLGQLMFVLNNYVYQTIPAHRTDNHIYIQPSFCLAVTHLQIVASKLLIYCTNNSYVLEYDIDIGDFVLPQFNDHLYFPCSENMDFSVNLTNTEISYRTNDVPSQSSGLRIGKFKFGECIMHQNHYLFLYVNAQNNNLYVVNSTMLALYNLTEGTPRTMCMSNEYDRPVFIGEKYIIAYDLGCQISSVFDLQDITSAIITLKSRSLLLTTVISNISAVARIDSTTITTDSAPPPEEFNIVPPIIVVLGFVLIIYSIFNVIILIMIWKGKSQRKNQQPVSEQGTPQHNLELRIMLAPALSLRNPSTQQLLDQSTSNRAPSGSSLLSSIPDPSVIDTGQTKVNNLSGSHSPWPVTSLPFQESSPHVCKNNDAELVKKNGQQLSDQISFDLGPMYSILMLDGNIRKAAMDIKLCCSSRTFELSNCLESTHCFGDIHGSHTERVHQTGYFSAAMNRGRVPFIYHHLLECNCDGIEFTIENHDITLRIPEGAVDRGKLIHFEIGVAMYGPFVFPKNSQPISPIVWLCLLEEDVELKKTYELILPHYLIGLTIDQLQNHHIGFTKAHHDSYLISSEQDRIRYRFNDLHDIQQYFLSKDSKSYGVLKSTHCCYLCIKANKTPGLPKDTSYCLARIESSLTSEVYFIASYFLNTCIEAWKEQLSDYFKLTRCENFRFNGEMIKIVPGCCQRDHCEIVLEPRKAEISASDIDFWSKDLESMELKHKMKMYPPRVKMTVLMKTTDHIKLSIDIIGCSNNLDMDLVLPIGVPLSSPASSPSSCGSLMTNHSQEIFTIDDKPKLKDLFRQLYPLAAHWENIGCLLGIQPYALNRISRDKEGVHDCLRVMLSEYLNQVDPSPTWGGIIEAVETIDSMKAKELNANLAHAQQDV